MADNPGAFQYNPPMPSREKLSEFAARCQKNITGDEKGQAQILRVRLWAGVFRLSL
jgi:hypothetical protein